MFRSKTATSASARALELLRGLVGDFCLMELRKQVPRAELEPLRTRIAADGSLVDVCTGTGKQKSLRDYYDRPAILGRDDRGGAMALMIATEMELYLAEQRK